MPKKQLEQIIENAASSVEMEGYSIDDQSKEWCKMLLNEEITMSEYISLVKKKASNGKHNTAHYTGFDKQLGGHRQHIIV